MSTDVFPKFLVEDDCLVIAKCTFHHQIVNDKDKVKGGGWWTRNDEGAFILYGSSFDFGAAKIKDIKNCIDKGNVFTDKYYTDSICDKHEFLYDTGTEFTNLKS